jgi:hypothetical protein
MLCTPAKPSPDPTTVTTDDPVVATFCGETVLSKNDDTSYVALRVMLTSSPLHPMDDANVTCDPTPELDLQWMLLDDPHELASIPLNPNDAANEPARVESTPLPTTVTCRDPVVAMFVGSILRSTSASTVITDDSVAKRDAPDVTPIVSDDNGESTLETKRLPMLLSDVHRVVLEMLTPTRNPALMSPSIPKSLPTTVTDKEPVASALRCITPLNTADE